MDLVKMLKALLKKGIATAEEKEKVQSLYKQLDEEDQEAVKEDVEKVEELPEEEESEEDASVEEEVEKSIKTLFKNEKKSIKDEVLEKVQKLLDDHKEKMKNEVGVYNKDVQKAEFRKKANELLRKELTALVNNDHEELKAVRKEMTSDSTGSPYAGYTTDDFLSEEIRHLQTQYGVAAREFTTVSFTQSSYKANSLATDVSVGWVDEAGSISSTQAVLGQSTLELKKLAAIVTLTRELLQETEIDFVSFLGSRVAEGFAQKEDEAFFKGDGTSTYGSFTGLLENSSVNETTMSGSTFASLSVSDLRDMQDDTPQAAHANGKYYMHRSILNIIRGLREDAVTAGDGAGAFLYKAPSGNDPANIDGYPIVTVEAMPSISDTAASTSFILFGDLKLATIRGIRGGIVTDRFDAGTVRNVANDADVNLITSDRQAVRWIQQVGYIAIIPTAVTKLTTASASA